MRDAGRDFGLETVGEGLAAVVIDLAHARRDGEPRRHRQADRRHFGEVRALAAEQCLHSGIAVGRPAAEAEDEPGIIGSSGRGQTGAIVDPWKVTQTHTTTGFRARNSHTSKVTQAGHDDAKILPLELREIGDARGPPSAAARGARGGCAARLASWALTVTCSKNASTVGAQAGERGHRRRRNPRSRSAALAASGTAVSSAAFNAISAGSLSRSVVHLAVADARFLAFLDPHDIRPSPIPREQTSTVGGL